MNTKTRSSHHFDHFALLAKSCTEGAHGVTQDNDRDEEIKAASTSLGAVAALLPALLLVLGPARALTLALAVTQGACLLALLCSR